ncbi:MAG: MBL fold metallo-hydrolase [Candidatus Hodarchaeales archaeon]|jgi:L-ascorbate metabolism protein UlaG (beta-lactamase superfamily)
MEKIKLFPIKGVFLVIVILIASFLVLVVINQQLAEDEIVRQDFLYYNGVNITWYGFGSFKFKTDNLTIFIDPYDISSVQVEVADVIIITHHHSDHLSVNDLLNLSIPSITEMYYPEYCSQFLTDINNSFNKNIVSPYDNITVKGITLNFVPSYTIDGGTHKRELGLLGVNIDFGGVRIFHPGDSDNIPEFESINTDIALIPIYFMDEALDIVVSINTLSNLKYAIPMHYYTINEAKEFEKKADCYTIILNNLNQ